MKKIFYKILTISLIISLFLLAGCASKEELPTVTISVWTDPANIDTVTKQLEAFKELHKNEANFVFTVSIEGSDTAKSAIMGDEANTTDIFTFADDQLDDLRNSGHLLEITQNTDNIYNNIGGKDCGAAEAITRDGKIYAYPYLAGNGYFLYYNKAYFTEDDVKSMDRILEVASKNNKKFTMEIPNGWYLYSFYKGAGFDLYNDNGANMCNWNTSGTKYTGVEVTESILDITTHDGFISLDDTGFIEAVKSGDVIAAINGPWNAGMVSEAWGDNYAATMLPCYTLAGDSVQMYNFTGYKLIGINANTKEPEWSMKVAEYLTSDASQLEIFANSGECPANINASNNEEVQATPAIAALAKQAPYSSRQSVANPYWDAAKKLGIVLASGNTDNKDIQDLLDTFVTEATVKQ